MPAEEPKEEPAAKDPLDSLFGDLPKEPAAEPAPAMESAPAEPPAAEPAKDSLDDLFGPPAAKPEMEAAPAVEPAAPPAAEPAKDSLDDLFGPPAATPKATPKEQPKADALDDLFGPPAAPKPAAADPFGMSEPAELPMRTWVDDTGKFQVTAQLVEVLDGKVRLLKDTGTTTTVAMQRLSDADQQYVQTLVALQGSSVIGRLAAR